MSNWIVKSLIFSLMHAITLTFVEGLDCIKVGPCKCEMSDGSGVVSLEGIHQNPDGSPKYSLYDPATYWTYEYNPCKGFTVGEHQDLAVSQNDAVYFQDFDLGVQSTEYFNYTDSSGLYVHYVAADGDRMSRINLQCNRGLPTNLLYFIGELQITEYDFILEGPCACPGGCNANGIIKVDTGNSGSDEPSSLKWDTVGYDLVSLLLHDLILFFLIGIVVFVMTYCCGYSCLTKQNEGGGLNNINYPTISSA